MVGNTNATMVEETICNITTPESESAEEIDIEYAIRGSTCGVRNLYQTEPDEDGETSRTTKLPVKMIESVKTDESAQFALILRYTKCYDGREEPDYLLGPGPKRASEELLGEIPYDGYAGVTTPLKRLEFKRPLRPLVYRWEKFVKVWEEEELDSTAKEHADLFYKIFEEELKDTLEHKKDLIRNRVITHPLVWILFEPGDMVISSSNAPRGYLFSSAQLRNRSNDWVLTCKHINFNGKRFGYKDQDFFVDAFVGTMPITSLPVYPLKYHTEKDDLQKTLIAQGKRWEEHKGYHYRQYEGTALEPQRKAARNNTMSRVVLSSTPKPSELTDDQRMITSDTVYGYSLIDKEWLEFSLRGVSEIEWNTHAFESLVLPQEQEGLKDLLLAVANAQSKQLDNFDDVRPPGVGKTLTADSVAEVMQVPLYAMSAGDLGTHAEVVEQKLQEILRIVPKWGAVLLDEADVFMEALSSADLERNELVSIFLRVLEYYEGILFLTTNRAEHIDPASRRHIWSQFLGRSANVAAFSDEQLDQLAVPQMNGRQIKNTLKTASLLAWSQEKELEFQHVQVVLNLRNSNALKID
ncbi:AAA family ATPase [Penicillium subrubescens]|uniref:AAA family ATPase n=1 Tax=Penicillium subrubescens TaxID=1316194 RepID=UPI0025455BD5|nr:AAA family ATPase [Penicillium subrubescens]KAJ5905601.1 AAA family ATPase [Penicillium subrubescens]